MTNRKITSIAFDVYFRGEGVVNRDGAGEQVINGSKQDVVFAKKINGKPFTSRDCILHEVLEEPFGFKLLSQSPNPLDRLEVNLSKWRMLRGNMDATEKATVRRKSPMMMTDAKPTEQCSDIVLTSSAKGNMGGVFYTENAGDVEQRAKVIINLSELQFISTDSQLTPPAVFADTFDTDNVGYEEIARIWAENYPNTPFPTVAYYTKGRDGDGVDVGAYQTEGVKLSDRTVADLVLWFLDRISSFHLTKNKAYLHFDRFDNVSTFGEGGSHSFMDMSELREHLLSSDFAVNSAYTETDTVRDYSGILAHIKNSKDDAKKNKKTSK